LTPSGGKKNSRRSRCRIRDKKNRPFVCDGGSAEPGFVSTENRSRWPAPQEEIAKKKGKRNMKFVPFNTRGVVLQRRRERPREKRGRERDRIEFLRKKKSVFGRRGKAKGEEDLSNTYRHAKKRRRHLSMRPKGGEKKKRAAPSKTSPRPSGNAGKRGRKERDVHVDVGKKDNAYRKARRCRRASCLEGEGRVCQEGGPPCPARLRLCAKATTQAKPKKGTTIQNPPAGGKENLRRCMSTPPT